MTADLEISGLGPLDDDDWAELEAIGAEMMRNGECYLSQVHYESEMRRLEQSLSRWTNAIANAERMKPDDPRLERAIKIMAQLVADLAACRQLFLKSWRPDRRRPN